MIATADELLAKNPEWRRVLNAYLQSEQEVAAQEPTSEDDPDRGWTHRLETVPGVGEGRLAPIHGKLIALGLLSYRLTGRTAGIVYRVTPLGRTLSSGTEPGPDELPDSEPCDETPDLDAAPRARPQTAAA